MIGEGYMLIWFVFLVVFKTSSLTFILFSQQLFTSLSWYLLFFSLKKKKNRLRLKKLLDRVNPQTVSFSNKIRVKNGGGIMSGIEPIDVNNDFEYKIPLRRLSMLLNALIHAIDHLICF